MPSNAPRPIRALATAALVLSTGWLAWPVLAQPAQPGRAVANAQIKAPERAALCMACHGRDGMASAIGTPHLAGQDATYLASALRAYRDGSRRSNPMNGIANALVDSDIDALAAWYAAQPFGGAAPADAAPAPAGAEPQP